MKTINRRHIPYTKLKAYLNEIGMRQEELGAMIGITKSAINQKLNGTGGDFSMKEVRKICLTLNISADEYFIEQKVSKTKLTEIA